MPDSNFGEIIQPLHCRASASRDKKNIALTFQSKDRQPVTVVLPVAGAVGLQRHLAQALYILTAQPPAVEPSASDAVMAVSK